MASRSLAKPGWVAQCLTPLCMWTFTVSTVGSVTGFTSGLINPLELNTNRVSMMQSTSANLVVLSLPNVDFLSLQYIHISMIIGTFYCNWRYGGGTLYSVQWWITQWRWQRNGVKLFHSLYKSLIPAQLYPLPAKYDITCTKECLLAPPIMQTFCKSSRNSHSLD